MIGAVLRNLLGNSIKYSQKNSVVEILYNSNDLIIRIKDFGVCFNDTVGRVLLTKHMPTTTGTTGEIVTISGLLLCKDFIELHKGKFGLKASLR